MLLQICLSNTERYTQVSHGNSMYIVTVTMWLIIKKTFFRYTKCKNFVNDTRTKLEHELITVSCRPKNKANKVYEDAYIILKKQKVMPTKINEKPLNVLVLGMDTTSRARAIQSMTKLVLYFKQNSWLDYRAFQKVKQSIALLILPLIKITNFLSLSSKI